MKAYRFYSLNSFQKDLFFPLATSPLFWHASTLLSWLWRAGGLRGISCESISNYSPSKPIIKTLISQCSPRKALPSPGSSGTHQHLQLFQPDDLVAVIKSAGFPSSLQAFAHPIPQLPTLLPYSQFNSVAHQQTGPPSLPRGRLLWILPTVLYSCNSNKCVYHKAARLAMLPHYI